MIKTQWERAQFTNSLVRIRQKLLTISKKLGVYSTLCLAAAGFEYTGNGDAACCKDCGLEVSNWTLDMEPFTVHLEKKPDCRYVQYIRTSNEHENALKRQKIRTADIEFVSINFVEIDLIQEVRKRTFSHWPRGITPSSDEMIKAGFFYCNMDDRVICVFCNLICQKWTPTDDPCEVHRTLSPNCTHVRARLIRPPTSSIPIINEYPSGETSSNYVSTSTNPKLFRSNAIVPIAGRHPMYAEVPSRHASFATWPHRDLPSVNDLVQAGFFYTGKKTIITCFYCNGSLQNINRDNTPMIVHARFFPNCAYVKHLCGNKKYYKIQEAERVRRERVKANEAKEKNNSDAVTNTNSATNGRQLLITDADTLSVLVAARLDLPISQRLLNRGFQLSVIKQCWEDQLRLKQDDFASETDLFVACLILQKQFEHINSKKEKVVIPSVKMRQIIEQNKVRMRNLLSNVTRSVLNTTNAERTILFSSPVTRDQNQSTSIPFSRCVICLTEENRLACIPCGHLATCVPCGYSLQSCPICRQEIKAVVRIKP